MTLGPALMATRGGGPGGGTVVRPRPRALRARGRALELFQVLWGVWYGYNLRGEHQRAGSWGSSSSAWPSASKTLTSCLEAHHALWAILLYDGEPAAARPHLEQGLRLYEPQRHHSHAARYTGHDPGVCCRILSAQSLWLLGYPDQALAAAARRPLTWPSNSITPLA